jgi:hypothetical protein
MQTEGAQAMQHSQLGDGRDRFDRRAFCKAAGKIKIAGSMYNLERE